jgi:hypothetical protein
MLASKMGGCLHLTVSLFIGGLPPIFKNIIITDNSLLETNALAYFTATSSYGK